MLMLADTINAVVGGDTHRDSHALEIASPTGTPIATLEIDNDEPGFAQALAWIAARASAEPGRHQSSPWPPRQIQLAADQTEARALRRLAVASGGRILGVRHPDRDRPSARDGRRGEG